jgi:VanZ family protein
LLPCEVSGEQSGFVTDIALRVFGFFGYEPDPITLQSIIRMTAHAVEFMILGVLIFLDRKTIDYPFYQMFLIGIGVALTDEIIQIFVPGRAFELLDLLIDFSGLCLGILVMVYIFRIPKRKQRHLLEDKIES